MRVLTALLMLLALPAFAGQVYRWVDAQGNVHYSDQAPPSGVKNSSQKNIHAGSPGASVSTETAMARLKNPVTLYVTSSCGAVCDRAKAHLARRQIPHTSKDPSASIEAGEALKPGGGKAIVPTITIGNEKIEGYLESSWDAALDKAGYPVAPVANP